MVDPLWWTITEGVLLGNLVTLVLWGLFLQLRCRLGLHDKRSLAWNTEERTSYGTECRRCLKRWT